MKVSQINLQVVQIVWIEGLNFNKVLVYVNIFPIFGATCLLV